MTSPTLDAANYIDIACPSCWTHRTRVLESRAHSGFRFRRRQCANCGFQFATRESIIPGTLYSALISTPEPAP